MDTNRPSGLTIYFRDSNHGDPRACGDSFHPCAKLVGGDSSISSKREQDSIIIEPYDEAVGAIVQRQQNIGDQDDCGSHMPCHLLDSRPDPNFGSAMAWEVEGRGLQDGISTRGARNSISDSRLAHAETDDPFWDSYLQGMQGGAPFKRDGVDTDADDCDPTSECKACFHLLEA